MHEDTLILKHRILLNDNYKTYVNKKVNFTSKIVKNIFKMRLKEHQFYTINI